MTHATQPAELQPYLQSAYWDGHHTGDQDTTPKEPLPQDAQRRQIYALAKAGLRELGNAFPLATLDRGRVFNPTDYALGTLAFLSEEVLDHNNYQGNITDASSHPVPERPVEISFTTHRLEGIDSQYRSQTMLGVVACPKGVDQHSLYTIPFSRRQEGWLLYGPLVRSKETPLTVGATRHDLIAPTHERFTRVNRIQIVSQGGTRAPAPKRYWELGLQFLRGLATD